MVIIGINALAVWLVFYLDTQFGNYVTSTCGTVTPGWHPTQHQVQIFWLGLINIAIGLWYFTRKHASSWLHNAVFIALVSILLAGMIGLIVGWTHVVPGIGSCTGLVG